MNKYPKHKTVKVSRGEVDIDVKLAPLIRLLWARGIETYECCQECRPGEACIEFPGTADVVEFLYVAQREYPDPVAATGPVLNWHQARCKGAAGRKNIQAPWESPQGAGPSYRPADASR
jgi:hypothetical protein